MMKELSKEEYFSEYVVENQGKYAEHGYLHDQGIQLHERKYIQRSPETLRNIKIFVDGFEKNNVCAKVQNDNSSIFTEPRFLKSDKYYRASTFSIDSWSIDSTLTESSEDLINDKTQTRNLFRSPKALALTLSTFLLCTIIVSTLVGIDIRKQNSTKMLIRKGQ